MFKNIVPNFEAKTKLYVSMEKKGKPAFTATLPELKTKTNKRKSEDSNNVLNSEIKNKRRRSKSGGEKKLRKVKRDKSQLKFNVRKVTNLDFKKICKVVGALLSVYEKRKKDGSSELFGDEAQKINLQVNCFKKAFCPTRLLRFKLPHPLYDKMSEICLFVADKKGVKKDIDKTVEHYTELLEQNEITNISKVLPLRALSTEYTQYEMRRKLANQFDVFLVDGRISHFMMKRLGRLFAYTSKTPIPFTMSGKDLKNAIQKALAKTQMTIRSTSDSFSVKIGTTDQSAEEIAANIEAVSQGLAEKFPGSWPNIRSLFLRTKAVPSLPIYMSVVSPNAVRIPVMKSTKAPKKEVVSGELTTMLDTTVDVRSDGSVTVHRAKKKETSELSDAEDEEIIKEALKHKKQSKTVREDEIEDGRDEERIIKEAERKLLRKLASGGDSESDGEGDTEDQKQPSKKKLKHVEKKNLKQENLKKKSNKNIEKMAKTNWIKSTKKGSKKLSKDQRKAKIKVKKADKNKK